MTKRLAKLGLIAWLAVAVCLIPYREAKAVLLPLIIGLVTVSALGAASYCEVSGCFTPISGASVAGAVGASGVQRIDATLSDGTKIRVPVTAGAGVPAPEAPSTAVPVSGADGTIAALQAITYRVSGGGFSCSNSSQAALCQGSTCQTACNASNATYSQSVSYYCPSGFNGPSADHRCQEKVAGTVPIECPAGYAATGTTCVLTDARLAVKDNAVDLYRNEQGRLSVADDADTVPENIVVSDGGGKIWGTDADGKPYVTEIKPSADGGAIIKIQSQGSGGYVNESTITIGGDGTIQSVGESSAPGAISVPSGGGAPVVGVTGTAQAVQFPSDYAKTGEASAAADKINARLDKLHEDLTKPGTPLADPTAPDGTEFTDGFFPGTFDNITSWRMPGHSSQCPTADLSFNAWGSYWDLNFVSHCQILESTKVQPVAEVSFVVLWLIVALFIVLGA